MVPPCHPYPKNASSSLVVLFDEADVARWHRATSEPHKICLICLDDQPMARAHQCLHCDASICNDCFRQYLTHKIQNGQVAYQQLVCPGHCRRPILRDTIQQIVSPSLFQKYTRFLQAMEHREAGQGYCPRPQCGHPLLSPPSHQSKRRVHCVSCQQSSCRDCGEAYHRWPQCDREYRLWCRTHAAQRCPSCSATIQKNGGCSHMKCTNCQHHFCWRCHAAWKDHSEALWWPLACVRSKHWVFGPTAPVRLVTKTVAATVGASAVVAAGAVVAGVVVGLAAVVVPPLAVYCGIRALRRDPEQGPVINSREYRRQQRATRRGRQGPPPLH
ncbi:hypothetical protein SDRG_12038 [Saprolegnia diclina VS20]|uniref:RBR-type E3 ubiquitin transferase n=1 Tax=Saprolegnia diclina (strain VS20) TaxID=1156394 RepID=T0Q6F2_SAPDV|nr:hypothetical protein SDRG_12038 [Saprolegnia diclina VS20]EQC30186.1 hypothetical protein SDRG_12038 [Saprolegnia diclina VS20]|eukprot:XP_008616318.1 hypothetical protein SDRG_12038 [Saprolegnia diclina VS20]